MRAIVKQSDKDLYAGFPAQTEWNPDNIVEIEQTSFLTIVEKINLEARYPLLTLRILLHITCGIDINNKIALSARHLAKKLDVHYDTVTKCLKFLREIGVVQIER